MPKIDIASVPERKGSTYPAPYHEVAKDRVRQRLGDAGGLNDFGVNRLQLPPGAWSSQRHWHSHEDEFVYVLSGEVVLVTDEGEQILRAGDCAAFPKSESNGHHLINKSPKLAICLEVGTRLPAVDATVYSDIDLYFDPKSKSYTRKDGTPYPEP
jgi:uncharacterized cupin superfamily protein